MRHKLYTNVLGVAFLGLFGSFWANEGKKLIYDLFWAKYSYLKRCPAKTQGGFS